VLHYVEILAVALEVGARILSPASRNRVGVEIVMMGGVVPGA
jgi:hypothetical protein